ncbi:MAG: hypothetical protein FJW64_08320, partial [Actinobacteria bacterium]|nr:hypothetical protein [Actinomycetota bacterium]
AGVERSDAGAARLAATLHGVKVENSGAQIDAVGYSLGTTMTAQAVGRTPGLVSHVWLIGSAGVTTEARDSLAAQVSSGQVSLSVTEADADTTARWGRDELIGSRHTHDPRAIAGADVFGSDGGWVVGYGSDEGEWGGPTEGHNAHETTVDRFAGWYVDANGGLYPTWAKEPQRGYLDPSAESFKHLVMGLREDLTGKEKCR